MAVFSKPVHLNCSCYELGHCWTPFCVKASTDVAKHVFKEALKIYGTLYFIAALLGKRGRSYYLKKLLPETLQSSVFLTINGTLFISLFCVWRKLVGYYIFCNSFICGIPACALSILIERKHRRLLDCFYFINSSFLPAYCAAVTAILVERKNRRGPLAVYLTNLAVETGFRMLVNRGIIRPVQHGEVFLFSIASAVYLYLFRKKDGLPKSTLAVFRFLVGSEELPQKTDTVAAGEQTTAPPFSTTHDDRLTVRSASLSRYLESTPFLAAILRRCAYVSRTLKATPKHRTCVHADGCGYYTLRGLLKMFGIGCVIQFIVKLTSSYKTLRKRPRDVLTTLYSVHSLGLGAFLGMYSAIFRAVNCGLRWWREKDSAVHGMVAGFLAGGTMMFYKSVTVTLYSCAKLVEILYFKGIESGHFPYFRYADVFIYAFSTAFVFHAAVLEPHALRPAYWKFLLRVTDNKFAGMNRKLLDIFGVNSSQLYPDYWPNYDPHYTSLIKPSS